MCRLERIHNGLVGYPLYFPHAANDFSYKELQTSRWENALVEYSRRLEEVAVVGRALDRRGRFEHLRPLFVRDRDFLAGCVQGLPLAVLLAADTAARLDAGLYYGSDVHHLDALGFQGDVLLLPQGVLQGVFLGPAGLPGRGSGQGAAQA